MNSGKAFLGVLAGIAAGAFVGMLFAPSSKARKNISKKGEALADALNDKIDEKFEEMMSAIAGRVKKSKTSGESESSAKHE